MSDVTKAFRLSLLLHDYVCTARIPWPYYRFAMCDFNTYYLHACFHFHTHSLRQVSYPYVYMLLIFGLWGTLMQTVAFISSQNIFRGIQGVVACIVWTGSIYQDSVNIYLTLRNIVSYHKTSVHRSTFTDCQWCMAHTGTHVHFCSECMRNAK